MKLHEAWRVLATSNDSIWGTNCGVQHKSSQLGCQYRRWEECIRQARRDPRKVGRGFSERWSRSVNHQALSSVSVLEWPIVGVRYYVQTTAC